MAILHLIHGYIGAGKTTFAKKLEVETGAIRFSPDEWMIERHGINPPIDMFGKYEEAIRVEILLAARQALKAGKDVIFDFGLWTRKERDEYRHLAKELGVESRLYFLSTDSDLAKQRTLTRTETMPEGALFIDENAFEILKVKFESLESDETHIVIA